MSNKHKELPCVIDKCKNYKNDCCIASKNYKCKYDRQKRKLGE